MWAKDKERSLARKSTDEGGNMLCFALAAPACSGDSEIDHCGETQYEHPQDYRSV